MAKPTLLIGIGTSGLKVLEETQKFYFEHTGKNKPGNVEYLYLETDESSFPATTVKDNEIRRIYLDLSDKETKINNLNNKLPEEESNWIPDPNYIKDAGQGAGGMPAFGRVALWSNPNFDTVKDTIRFAINQINSHTQHASDHSLPAVFITGSLTGGTGAGVFIDLAYMVKAQIPGLQDVYGLFLTPGRSYIGKDNILYCNTLSSLAALEKYNSTTQPYEMNWPDSTRVKLEEMPFEMTHFISQDRNDGTAQVNSVKGLYKIAGLWLFLNIFGLREKRHTRIIDSKGSAFIDKYGTFGIAAIQYPKSQLQELLSVELGIDLLERWTDLSAFYNKGNKTQIKAARQRIVSETKAFFEKALKNAFEMLDATSVDGYNSIKSDLETRAQKLNKKELEDQPSEAHYLKKWFSSNGDNNYYTALSNDLKKAEDILIQEIQEFTSNSLDKNQNLKITEIQLKAVNDAIDDNINYWQTLNLSPKPEKWENTLDKKIKWVLKNRYKLIGEQDAVVYDRLLTLFELLKIHLIGKRFVAIRNNIKDNNPPLRTFEGSHSLPKINQVNDLMKKLKSVIENSDNREETTGKKSKKLSARKQDIIAELNDITIPILRVYPDGSSPQALERVQELAKSKYFSISGTNIPGKNSLIGEDSLWNYLNDTPDNLTQKLFTDCIVKFESDVITKNCFEDMDITDFISKNPSEAGKMALIAKTPLLMVNNDNQSDFTPGKGIPRLIIGKNKNQIDQVYKSLTSDKEFSYLNSYSNDDDGVWLNEEMDNMVIFYVEQGYMTNGETFSPLKHLRYINDIKSSYSSEKNRFLNAKGVNEDTWHQLRGPYTGLDEFQEIINKK